MKIILRLILLSILCLNAPRFGVENRVRVGTTGDYPPLTLFDEKNHSFSGLDVDLLTKFAEQNNIKIDWVKTEWESLSTDFQVGKFDV
ncbi:MAG: transporter substrate-binding domain-containing protein, partial [Shewanella sp.]|nr:transporter substrate-binding domain-containing protein [Shewanella sp.]